MKRDKTSGQIVFSPTDLIHFLDSPFGSWMDRYHLENPSKLKPDDQTEDEKLIVESGNQHEAAILSEIKKVCPQLVEIPKDDFNEALKKTRDAIQSKSSIIYQGALQCGPLAGYSDFLFLDAAGVYQRVFRKFL